MNNYFAKRLLFRDDSTVVNLYKQYYPRYSKEVLTCIRKNEIIPLDKIPLTHNHDLLKLSIMDGSLVTLKGLVASKRVSLDFSDKGLLESLVQCHNPQVLEYFLKRLNLAQKIEYSDIPLLSKKGEGTTSLFKLLFTGFEKSPQMRLALDNYKNKAPKEFYDIIISPKNSNYDFLGKLRNRKGESLLHTLCKYGTTKGVDSLLHYAPELLNQKDKENQSPLEVAAAYGNIDIVKRLIEASATRPQSYLKDPTTLEKMMGFTPQVSGFVAELVQKSNAHKLSDENLSNRYREIARLLYPVKA